MHWFRKNLLMTPLLTFVLSISVVATVNAGLITQFHNNLAGFNAAAGALPITIEDFTNTAHFPITTGTLNTATNLPGIGIIPGTIQPGVTYSTPVGVGNFFNIDCCYNGTPFLDTVTSNGPLTVTFDALTLGFGFNSGIFINGLTVTINFASDPSQVFNPFLGAGDNFYGFFSSTADITSILIGGSTTQFTFAIDDFRFTTGSVTTIPEPTTIALFAIGLAGLGFMRRRRRVL